MSTLIASLVPQSQLKRSPVLHYKQKQNTLFFYRARSPERHRSIFPVARLFEPAIFEESKLKVLFLGIDEKNHPGNLPRTYTLTHNDITAKLTLAISQTINNSQLKGWSNNLYRDEVVAEWKKVKGKMSLHVHCHISGAHFLLNLCAGLRYSIFNKELPVVLKAFFHGDMNLFNSYPELEKSLVWVYFHSNISEFNRVECLGPFKEAQAPSSRPNVAYKELVKGGPFSNWEMPQACQDDCSCCSPSMSLIHWSQDPIAQNIL